MVGDVTPREAQRPVSMPSLIMTQVAEVGAVCEPGGDACTITDQPAGTVTEPAGAETRETPGRVPWRSGGGA